MSKVVRTENKQNACLFLVSLLLLKKIKLKGLAENLTERIFAWISRNETRMLYNFRLLNNTTTHNTYNGRYTIKVSHAIDISENGKVCDCLTH